MASPTIHVVLARPSEPRNIGATCRAMKNFGFTRLSIVSAREIDFGAAAPLAVGAEDVLRGAAVVRSLGEALGRDSLVAGVTRRLGQKRKAISYTPWEFADHLRGRERESIAVVFGNEQSGLSDDELEQCHMAVSIPTSPECPSLNLSHAVEIIAYEIYSARIAERRPLRDGALGSAGPSPQSDPLVTGEIAAAADSIAGSLGMLTYHAQDGPQGMKLFMRDLIARAGLSRVETKRLQGLFATLAGMHGKKRRAESDPLRP